MQITQDFFDLPEAITLSMTVRGRSMLFMLLKIYSFADANGNITYTNSELATLCRTRTQEINHCFEACDALIHNIDFKKSLGFIENPNAETDECAADQKVNACMDASMDTSMSVSANTSMDASVNASMSAFTFPASFEEIFNYCEERRKSSVQANNSNTVTYDEPLDPWDEYRCAIDEMSYDPSVEWHEITSEEGDKLIEALIEEVECKKQRKETPIKEILSPTPPYKENITKEKKLYISARVREDGANDREAVPRDAYAKDIEKIINYLNQKLHTNYKLKSKKTVGSIKARLNEGYTFDDFKTVIDKKHDDWIGDSLMVRYLKPTTLFSSNHFDEYLNQLSVPVSSKNLSCRECVPTKKTQSTSSFNLDDFFELAVRRGAGRAVGLAV